MAETLEQFKARLRARLESAKADDLCGGSNEGIAYYHQCAEELLGWLDGKDPIPQGEAPRG